MKKIWALIIAAAMIIPYAGASVSADVATIHTDTDNSSIMTSGAAVDTSKSTETYEDFRYTVLEDGTVEITKYIGTEEDAVIPSEIDGRKVTTINNFAFYSSPDLTGITIPESVTSIGIYTIYNCNSLQSINVDENNKNYSSLDGVLFNKEQTELIAYPKAKNGQEYAFPEGVTSIRSYAFYEAKNLISLTIPNSVNEIDEHSFNGCSNLTNITLPNNLAKIANYTFSSCSSLTTVTIPASVTSIGLSSFSGCENINDVYYLGTQSQWEDIQIDEGNTSLITANIHATDSDINTKSDFLFNTLDNGMLEIKKYIGDGGDVVIPTTVAGTRISSIGPEAFYDCEALTSITIPNSVSEICFGAFSNCTNLTSVTLSNRIKILDANTFTNCQSLTSITLPENLTTIGENAFNGCRSLTDITIPEGVTDIYEGAFISCTNLDNIVIPESVKYIGENCFGQCTSLKSITIPKNVETIGLSAFLYCSSLLEINVDENNKNYSSEDGVLFDKEKTTIIAFPQNKQGKYVIPNTVTVVDSFDFLKCSGLTSITIPESVSSIFASTFRYCYGLNEIIVDENNVNYSSENGILYNKDKTILITCPPNYQGELTVPASVTTITDGAFANCTSLTKINVDSDNKNYTSIDGVLYSKDETELITCPPGYKGEYTIPESITNIDNKSIYNSLELTAINVDEKNPNFSSVDGILFNKDKTVLISCPPGYQGEYVIPNSVEIINECAFYNCKGLTKVTVPGSVTTISYYTFFGCSNLTDVIISEGVTTIKDYAFSDCESLINLDIPNSVTQMDSYIFLKFNTKTFLDNYEGDFVILGDGILFYYKGNGGDVIIPEGVKTISQNVFTYCENIASITIPTTVKSIYEYAFYECTPLNNVYYIGTEEEWNQIEIADNNDSLTNTDIYFEWIDTPNSPNESETPDEPLEPIGIYGDLTGDGRISSIDALYVQRFTIGYSKLSDEEKLIADVNCDGKVNTLDALKILKYCTGYKTNTNVGSPVYPTV